MSSREELIQAKMAELRLAEEERKRKIFDAEIAAEARMRIESEKTKHSC
jgi:hypothetical protein